MENKSYFDGGLLQLIGRRILGFIVTFCTLGICYPWALCMVYGWETRHTVVNGHRLAFDGTALQLFGKWIVMLLWCIVPGGVDGVGVGIARRKWKVSHTHFAD